MGVEAGGKGIVFGKLGAVDLQVVVPDTPRVHPAPQTLVPDELDRADGLIYRGLLGLIDSGFVFENQHSSLAFGWLPVLVGSLLVYQKASGKSTFMPVLFCSGQAVGPFIPGLKAQGFLAQRLTYSYCGTIIVP